MLSVGSTEHTRVVVPEWGVSRVIGKNYDENYRRPHSSFDARGRALIYAMSYLVSTIFRQTTGYEPRYTQAINSGAKATGRQVRT